MHPKNHENTCNVLLASGVICLLILGAGALVKAKDEQVRSKAQEIFALYQANPQVPDTRPFEAFHQEGLSLATSILMNKAEKAGDLVERDRLFTEAYQRFSDVELSTLLFGHRPLFSEADRQERLKAAQDTQKRNPVLAKAMTLSATSTLSVVFQSQIQACSKVLAEKYRVVAGKPPVVRMAWDGFFGTQTCKS
jgi:hypothetical protein